MTAVLLVATTAWAVTATLAAVAARRETHLVRMQLRALAVLRSLDKRP